jgi:2-dehydropantoate 2-reductase
MRICVVGTGVIGTIFGHVLTASGYDVTHYVAPGRIDNIERGLEINLLDSRSGTPVEALAVYRPPVVHELDPDEPFDLIVASVRHYQVPDLLPVLAEQAGPAEILFFNNLWTSFEPIDEYLRDRYIWGFPVAGGGFDDGRLEAALLGDVQLGPPHGGWDDRVERLRSMFARCGLGVNVPTDMLTWLWVHFATEAGVIGRAIKAGSVDAFLDDVDAIAEAVLAVRDALSVVKARGVDPLLEPDAQTFFAPEQAVAQAIKDLYQTDRAARKIMERHTAGEELRRVFADVVETGRLLDVTMPNLEALEPYVEAFQGKEFESASG